MTVHAGVIVSVVAVFEITARSCVAPVPRVIRTSRAHEVVRQHPQRAVADRRRRNRVHPVFRLQLHRASRNSHDRNSHPADQSAPAVAPVSVYDVATATFGAISNNSDGFGPRYTLNPAVPDEKLNPDSVTCIRVRRPKERRRHDERQPAFSPAPIQRAHRVIQRLPARDRSTRRRYRRTQTDQRNRRRPVAPALAGGVNATLNRP